MKFARLTMIIGAAALTAVLLASPMLRQADAQVPSNPAPYNVDLGAVITNTLRTAGTVTTQALANTNWRGVICRLMQTESSGSPSTTFKIQGYDAATASWSDLATSGAVTGYITVAESTTGQTVLVYPGAVMTTTPTGWVMNAVPLPRTWRVSQTIGNGTGAAGPASTSKIGCNYLL